MLNPKYCRSVVSSKMLFSLSSLPDKWASVPVPSGHTRPICERLPNAVETWSQNTFCWRYTFILARTIPPETQACWEPMQDSLFFLNSLTFYAQSGIRPLNYLNADGVFSTLYTSFNLNTTLEFTLIGIWEKNAFKSIPQRVTTIKR